ncbi:MAG: hypothetical protein RB191_10975 [Terriglobia bacterium]|nr:hypothetical protein [Terriglobia bacterium]
MSAVIDTFTGQPDPGLTADAKFEARIEQTHQRMVAKGASEEASRELYSEWCRLIWSRSKTQQIKQEIARMQKR